MPPLAEGRPVEPLFLQPANGDGEALFRFANTASPEEHREHRLTGTAVQRRDLEPALHAPLRLFGVGRWPAGELSGNGSPQSAKALPPAGKPARKLGTAIEIEALQQVAAEPVEQLDEAIGRDCGNALRDDALDFEGVDEGVGQI